MLFAPKIKPDQFALLNCPQPGRGKSQAIEHNSALPKVGQSLRRLRLVCLPLARPAGSGNGLLCLAPQPGQQLFWFALLRLFIRAMRKVVLIPARPAGLPAAARTALLVPAEGSPASRLPRWGSPRARPSHRITSTNSLLITPRRESA